jgi:iron complex transport system permease protein
VLPASALCGAALLATADVIARTSFAPQELPVGILTAVLGAPFFLILLMRHRNRVESW